MSEPIKTCEEYTIETKNRTFYLSIETYKDGRVGATFTYKAEPMQVVTLDVDSETMKDIAEALRLSIPIVKELEKKALEIKL